MTARRASGVALLLVWLFAFFASCGLWAALWIFLHWVHSLSAAQLDRGLTWLGAFGLAFLGCVLLGVALGRVAAAADSGGPARSATRSYPSAGRPALDPHRSAATSPAPGAIRAAGPPESTVPVPTRWAPDPGNRLEAGGMGRCRVGRVRES